MHDYAIVRVRACTKMTVHMHKCAPFLLGTTALHLVIPLDVQLLDLYVYVDAHIVMLSKSHAHHNNPKHDTTIFLSVTDTCVTYVLHISSE